LFEAVQAKLNENLRGRRLHHQSSNALLKGRLFDDRGNAMTPSYAIKKGVRYRYYVSSVLAQGRKEEVGQVARVAAEALERTVLDALAARVVDRPSKTSLAEASIDSQTNMRDSLATRAESADPNEGPLSNIRSITLRMGSIDIQFQDGPDGLAESFVIPWTPQTFTRKREVIARTAEPGKAARPIRAEARAKLLAAISKARRWLDELVSGDAADIEAIAVREGISERSARMSLSLAFLAPKIVQAAVDGTLPRGLGVSRLTDLSPIWAEQHRAIGIVQGP
jgi:hypothetical protein